MDSAGRSMLSCHIYRIGRTPHSTTFEMQSLTVASEGPPDERYKGLASHRLFRPLNPYLALVLLIGPTRSFQAAPVSCSASVPTVPLLGAESLAEKTWDIVTACTDGSPTGRVHRAPRAVSLDNAIVSRAFRGVAASVPERPLHH